MSTKNYLSDYELIKSREVKELKDALNKAGGRVDFNDNNAPVVLVYFNGQFPHPTDVRITTIVLKNDEIFIEGQEKDNFGSYDEQVQAIDIKDIAYLHTHLITECIPEPKKDNGYLLQETIALLSADIYNQVYAHCESYTEACSEIVRLAKQFEKELDWKDDDERDYVFELEKFENKYLSSLDTEKRTVRMYLGITLEGTKSEIDTIIGACSGTDEADKIISKLLKKGSYTIEGNSYIPQDEVDGYNTYYGTDHPLGQIDFEFNL